MPSEPHYRPIRSPQRTAGTLSMGKSSPGSRISDGKSGARWRNFPQYPHTSAQSMWEKMPVGSIFSPWAASRVFVSPWAHPMTFHFLFGLKLPQLPECNARTLHILYSALDEQRSACLRFRARRSCVCVSKLTTHYNIPSHDHGRFYELAPQTPLMV